jgi:adenylate cyclase
LCTPLHHDEEVLGVLYLESDSAERFDLQYLNLLQGLGAQVAMCLKNASLLERVERETRLATGLSRYLPPGVVARIGDGSLSPNLGGELAEGTVLFTDIVGFTTLAERLPPNEVMTRLNRYFDAMLEVLFAWSGTVDKFGGDALVAVWGAPVPEEGHARLATAAALEMQGRLFELNEVLEKAGETRLGMAAGLSSGRFVAGNIGGERRLEWTVIGDTVNLAKRVESRSFRGGVLTASSTVARLAGGVGGFAFDPLTVKGRSEPVSMVSVRTLNTHRGVLASIPGTVRIDGEETRALLVKVHGPSGAHRVTLRASITPAVGDALSFVTRLPECEGVLAFAGRVVSSSPLLDARAGRSVDVTVERLDETLGFLLRANGTRPAARALDLIERG